MRRAPSGKTEPAPAWRGFVASLVVVPIATVASWTFLGRQYLADVVMVYLLGTVLVSMRYGYGPSVGAAVMSVLCFNFFFIPPYYTFAVADLRHVVTFAVMFLVAIVISRLTKRVRDEADAARAFAEEAHRAELRVESEQLRNALLSSVSHDLRTPLAVVTGAASTLLDDGIAPPVRRELTESILQEAERLNRLVQNLLDMTRVEAGTLRVHRDWQPLEEVIGSALGRAERMLAGREVTTRLPSDLTLVPLDSILIEQVLVNLLENAAKYTPGGSAIEVGARVREGTVEVTVADTGPGIRPGEEARLFEKFYRGRTDRGGAGLGLAICKGIITAHGGRIWVESRDGGGACFRFTLPIDGEPPRVRSEPIEQAMESVS
jgi:two-component system, OmpR family, sensor histidine kinase KdpD